MDRQLWVLAALACAIPARAESLAGAQQSIMQIYGHFEAAFEDRDVNRLYIHCDPGYTYTNAAGVRLSLAEQSDSMAELLSRVTYARVRIRPLHAQLVGQQLLLRYRQVHYLVFPPHSAPRVIEHLAEDTWQVCNGQWRLISTRVINPPSRGVRRP